MRRNSSDAHLAAQAKKGAPKSFASRLRRMRAWYSLTLYRFKILLFGVPPPSGSPDDRDA